jgi:hypothetical protein
LRLAELVAAFSLALDQMIADLMLLQHSPNLRTTPVTARRDGTPGLLVPALELALDDLARHLSLSAVDAPPGHCGALLSISPNRSSTSDSAFEYTAAIRDQLPSTLRTLLRRT